jgi:hypothetical protein
MSRKITRRFEIALAACVVLIAVIVAWQAAIASKRPLDSEDMKIDVADLGSYAAEGELLARQRVGASITRSYSKVQSEMWRDKIEEIVRKYQLREPAADLTKSFGEVSALAQRLLAAADALMGNVPKEGTAGEAASKLKQVESDARELKSHLAATPD